MSHSSKNKQSESVSHPSHYTSLGATCADCGRPIECIDVIKHFDFRKGSAIKYIWRCEIKHDTPLEDLRKAREYIDSLIADAEAEQAAG